MGSTATILVLCGLPACGKSTLSNTIKETCQLSDASSLRKLKCIIVRYDDLIPSQLKHDTNPSTGESEWKEYRRCILEAVTQIVISITNGDSIHHDLEWQPVQQMKSKIIQENVQECAELIDNNSKFLIVIDDNMYFKSMRYEYFQLARRCNAGFCQIYLKCPLRTALQRNRWRTIIVADEILERMAKKFEEPLPDSHSWEQFTCTIENDSDHFKSSWNEISRLLKTAFEHPFSSSEDDQLKEMQDTSRNICAKNLVHQVDQVLRKIISDIMKNRKGDGYSSGDMKSTAVTLNEMRHIILDDVKAERLTLPEKLIQEIEGGNLATCLPILETFLADKMNLNMK